MKNMRGLELVNHPQRNNNSFRKELKIDTDYLVKTAKRGV